MSKDYFETLLEYFEAMAERTKIPEPIQPYSFAAFMAGAKCYQELQERGKI